MKIGLNFHETFPPTPAYIGRIISIADGKERSIKELSQMTGIPQGVSSGKCRPHLIYSYLMGLLEEDLCTITKLGEVIRSEDPSCSEELTQWILHKNLVSTNGAPLWNWLFRYLLPENNMKTTDDYLMKQAQDKFGTNVKTSVCKTCYLNGLSEIHYLNENSTGFAVNPQKVITDYLFLYAYDLFSEWDALYAEKNELTADEMFRMKNAACFGLTEDGWFEALEMIAGKNLIRINRQLTPFTIIRNASTEVVIPQLYSLLL